MKPANRFAKFLSAKNAGDKVSLDDILLATNWKKSSFDTNFGKHKFEGFLQKKDSNTYVVLRDPSTFSEQDVLDSLSQVARSSKVATKPNRVETKKNGYDFIEKLGTGATAEVWLAKGDDGVEYAVKLFSPREDLLDPSHVKNIKRRFVREGKNGMRIRSDNVVRIFDFGENSEKPFVVMEKAIDCVANMLKEKETLSFKTALEVVSACLKGLIAIHEAGCIHRDVKPSNILSTPRGYVVGDLGIVDWSDFSREFTDRGTITAESVLLGSINYMSPEQHSNPHSVTFKTDVYSLGVTWLQLLTGRIPSSAAIAYRDLKFPPEADSVSQLILDMTEYQPAARPEPADVLLEITNLLEKVKVRPR